MAVGLLNIDYDDPAGAASCQCLMRACYVLLMLRHRQHEFKDGSYGQVFQGVYLNAQVAIKVLNIDYDDPAGTVV
jgi:hypothetical protein